MPTFKAVVMKHQERQDGKFPVSIRVTHNQKSVYIPTGLYVAKKQIHPKTFELKDQFVIGRTNDTIREYQESLLSISRGQLMNMSAADVKRMVNIGHERIDFYAWCENHLKSLTVSNSKRLEFAIRIMKQEMGIREFYATDFTSAFLEKYKRVLDNRYVLNRSNKKTQRKMTEGGKRVYTSALCAAFRNMKKEYNTEFVQVIKHDPFCHFENYRNSPKKRKSIDEYILRRFFTYNFKTASRNETRDIILLSFCLCGINLADLYAMNRNCYDPRTHRITYNRRKTRKKRSDEALSSIRLEDECWEVFKKFLTSKFNMLFNFSERYKDSNSFSHTICNKVYEMCKEMGVERFSPYWFRHTWATIARNKCGVSKDDIDLCLNHTGNNPMADVYIDYDWSIIDRANRKVLDYVFHSDKE